MYETFYDPKSTDFLRLLILLEVQKGSLRNCNPQKPKSIKYKF